MLHSRICLFDYSAACRHFCALVENYSTVSHKSVSHCQTLCIMIFCSRENKTDTFDCNFSTAWRVSLSRDTRSIKIPKPTDRQPANKTISLDILYSVVSVTTTSDMEEIHTLHIMLYWRRWRDGFGIVLNYIRSTGHTFVQVRPGGVVGGSLGGGGVVEHNA